MPEDDVSRIVDVLVELQWSPCHPEALENLTSGGSGKENPCQAGPPVAGVD
jgi:hypothetical protein